jgi:hypothetical protein
MKLLNEPPVLAEPVLLIVETKVVAVPAVAAAGETRLAVRSGPAGAATQLLPLRTNPLSQEYSHFAAVSVLEKVYGVLARRPVLSGAGYAVAFAGMVPVQEYAGATQAPVPTSHTPQAA